MLQEAIWCPDDEEESSPFSRLSAVVVILQCDACVCVTFVLSMNHSTSNLCFNEFNGYSTLMFEGSLDLYDKEWKRITELFAGLL
jgi:hypothetical protein